METTTIDKIKEEAVKATEPTVIIGYDNRWYKTGFAEFFTAVKAEHERDNSLKDIECIALAAPKMQKTDLGVSGRVTANDIAQVSKALKEAKEYGCQASIKNLYLNGQPWVYESSLYGSEKDTQPRVAIIQIRNCTPQYK